MGGADGDMVVELVHHRGARQRFLGWRVRLEDLGYLDQDLVDEVWQVPDWFIVGEMCLYPREKLPELFGVWTAAPGAGLDPLIDLGGEPVSVVLPEDHGCGDEDEPLVGDLAGVSLFVEAFVDEFDFVVGEPDQCHQERGSLGRHVRGCNESTSRDEIHSRVGPICPVTPLGNPDHPRPSPRVVRAADAR